MLSGVARSVNAYPIGAEKPEDGIVNLAFGLGKTVVDGGHTLRFDPAFPKKILQLSQPSIALRDTQRKLYALDLRPASFKISRNDSMNLLHLEVSEALKSYDYPHYVASVYSAADNRIVPGINATGPRIITFDAILKYGKFPLGKIISDVLAICKEELMCDAEIEFAADVIPEGNGSDFVLKLLQVRPISQYDEDRNTSVDQISKEISRMVATSPKALGAGGI